MQFYKIRSSIDNKMDIQYLVKENENLLAVPNFVKLNAKKNSLTFKYSNDHDVGVINQ